MKALISAHGRKVYPMTHNHERLIEVLDDLGEKLPALPYDLLDLEPFAVELRYDIRGDLSEAEMRSIKQTVVCLREHVLVRILELEQGSNP